VRETAQCIEKAIKAGKRFRGRAFDNIPGIIKNIDVILNTRRLTPIVVPGGTWRKAPYRQMKGDIDDGCMRAIAFAIKGNDKFNAFFGYWVHASSEGNVVRAIV